MFEQTSFERNQELRKLKSVGDSELGALSRLVFHRFKFSTA